MTYILLFELVIFAIFIFFGGTLGMIVSNVYSDLTETTEIRSHSLEDSMYSVSDTAEISYEGINNSILQGLNSGGYDAAFTGSAYQLLTAASQTNASGAFVILGTDITADRLPALYIRKTGRVLQNQNFSLNIASDNVISRLGILKDTNWRSSMDLNENNCYDIVEQTIKIAQENPEVPATQLGYWTMPYQINYDGVNAIAYTLPLRDSNGNCIGVYGIEIKLSYIRYALPYLELNSKGMGSYVLLCRDANASEEFSRVAVSGNTFDSLNNFSSTVVFKDKAKDGRLAVLDTTKEHSSEIYSTVNELNIWKNSSYGHKEWMLCGVVDSVYLNDLENGIRFNVLLAFALTMILGLVFAYIASHLLASPIHKFLNEIKMIRPDNPVIPSKSDITEINDLARVVEGLTADITDFSAKVSTIIDLAGLQFGAFEYDENSDFVFCTDMLYTLLNMEKVGDKLFVPKHIFEEKMGIFCDKITPNLNCVYKMKMLNGSMKFVHLKTAVNNGKILGVIQDTTMETVNERARKLARDYDAMTNLLNRTAFRRSFGEQFASDRSITAVLVHCNIDKMSDINVRYGTSTGDKFITGMASLFKKYANRINSFAARTAGDEFKLLLLGNNRADMEAKLKKLLNDIYSYKIQTNKGAIKMEASIGIAWYPEDTDSPAMLEQYAEFAMRQVKKSTRNAYKYFDKHAFEEAEKNIRSSRNIEMLISDGLIRYAFQPIVNARTGKIYGYEALMRPDSTNAITPHDVIMFATEQNKLNVIEKITWFTALEDFSIQVDPLSGKKMFINSIPSQMLSNTEIADIEARYGEYLGNIVLEIIENEQTDPNIINKKKALVEKWGCLLALDDYGSGYANDNTLLSLKPDVIKLDIEMITGIEDDSDRQTLVKNIIAYAHQRNILVLAEGIETYTQMKALIGYGVDLMQGFYLAKPNFDTVESIDEKVYNEILAIRNK